jgi:hypothetical protein
MARNRPPRIKDFDYKGCYQYFVTFRRMMRVVRQRLSTAYHAIQRCVRRVVEYLAANPVCAGLVEYAEDYPFLWTLADGEDKA